MQRGEQSMYLQEDNAVVIHGHRVLQLDGPSFIVPDSFPDVWSHSLVAPEQHAGERLLQNTGNPVMCFLFGRDSTILLICPLLLGTSASAVPRRAWSLSHWKI